MFGALNPAGLRQYRTVYCGLPRKSGKTEIAAAVALYMLLGDGEHGAEVYSAACDLEQASLCFNTAAQMVRNDPELRERLEIIPSRRRIIDHKTGSFYRAIPADAASAHGYNASCVIADELHAWKHRDLWDVLTTSMGARSQPLTLVISTAGFDRNTIWFEIHDYAEKVRDGVITDPTFLPVIYAAAPEADWLDEDVWKAVNPALGDFRSLDEMRVMARQAKEVPARQNTFRRLYLNQMTESETRWLDIDAWDQGATPVDAGTLEGRTCYAGLDLSTTTDLSAFVLVFPDDDGGYDVLPYFWCPEDGIAKRARKDRVPYDEWARRGFLESTPGNVVDYEYIRDAIKHLSSRYHIQEIAYDPWNATQLVTQLQEDGAHMVEIRQGFASLSAPSKEFEKLVVSGKLRHGGHPILRAHVKNVVVRMDPAGNIKPDKGKSTERVDGVFALVMALSRATGATGTWDELTIVGA